MKAQAHEYRVRLSWDGNTGDGTVDYESYGRNFRARIDGKPELAGSADPAFRGDPGRHNPEELFVSAIAACHMLVYLALCAKRGVRVLDYTDCANGTMLVDAGGSGRFTEVVLKPVVTLARGTDMVLASQLHERAHKLCYLANSCAMPIRHEAVIHLEAAA